MIDLKNEGVDIVDSVLLPKGTTIIELEKIANKNKWSQCVLKPCVGAVGESVEKLFINQIPQKTKNHFNNLMNQNDFILQPYISSIKHRGEISIILFNHCYSHAVLKMPLQNDFKVQGGKIESYNPTKEQIETAIKISKAALKIVNKKSSKSVLLFSRIDLLFSNQNEKMLLGEVEGLDPELFFRKSSKSIQLFCDEIIKQL